MKKIKLQLNHFVKIYRILCFIQFQKFKFKVFVTLTLFNINRQFVELIETLLKFSVSTIFFCTNISLN